MKTVTTPQCRCRAAVACCDITPPTGIYHRMWGAALHDRATGVHRPLEATLLWLEPQTPTTSDPEPGTPTTSAPQIIVALDHCILDRDELQAIRRSIHAYTDVAYENVLVTVSHTHGAGWMSRTRSDSPGGDLLGPYLDELAARLGDLAREAQTRVAPATIVFGTGRCSIAAHRDFFDPDLQRFVCGFNPDGLADDTLLVARISDDSGEQFATVVNYACHPTTLAWDNTLISPDWVGAMREVIQQSEGGRCLFLQGASGDLGPREGFTGDIAVADRNGRHVGHAVLSTLATLPSPGTEYRYAGPVISGTAMGTWSYEQMTDDAC